MSYTKEGCTEEKVARGFKKVEVTAKRFVGQLVQVDAKHQHEARIRRWRQILSESPRPAALQVERRLQQQYGLVYVEIK